MGKRVVISKGEEEIGIGLRKGKARESGKEERRKMEEPGEIKRQRKKETKESRKKPLENCTIYHI